MQASGSHDLWSHRLDRVTEGDSGSTGTGQQERYSLHSGLPPRWCAIRHCDLISMCVHLAWIPRPHCCHGNWKVHTGQICGLYPSFFTESTIIWRHVPVRVYLVTHWDSRIFFCFNQGLDLGWRRISKSRFLYGSTKPHRDFLSTNQLSMKSHIHRPVNWLVETNFMSLNFPPLTVSVTKMRKIKISGQHPNLYCVPMKRLSLPLLNNYRQVRWTPTHITPVTG